MKNCRFAATGGADQHAACTGGEPQVESAHDFDVCAIRRNIAFRIDAKLKRAGVASGLHVVQKVAPQAFRSRA